MKNLVELAAWAIFFVVVASRFIVHWEEENWPWAALGLVCVFFSIRKVREHWDRVGDRS